MDALEYILRQHMSGYVNEESSIGNEPEPQWSEPRRQLANMIKVLLYDNVAGSCNEWISEQLAVGFDDVKAVMRLLERTGHAFICIRDDERGVGKVGRWRLTFEGWLSAAQLLGEEPKPYATR